MSNVEKQEIMKLQTFVDKYLSVKCDNNIIPSKLALTSG